MIFQALLATFSYDVTGPESGPDSALVAGVLAGDGESVALFVRRYHGLVFGIAYRMTGDASLSEDLSQEVFLRALAALPKFDAARPLLPWIRSIAARHVLNFVTRSPRRRETALESSPVALGLLEPGHDPHERLEAKERERSVRRALLVLPEKQRLVITLKYGGDLTTEEISDILEVPRNTVKTWLLRAREILRKELTRAV